MESLSCAGGILEHDAGENLSKLTYLYSTIASTETSFIQYLLPPEDWEYLSFAPQNGIEWRRANDDQDLYELVLRRSEEYEEFQLPFAGKPVNIQEISTGDLYEPHSAKPGLWKIVGRADDMIIYGNGWNFYPNWFEEIVATNPAVSCAVVVGNGRMDSILLVELKDPRRAEDDEEGVLGDIYPTINRAWKENGNKPITRVGKSHVILAKADKPFVRTVKGGVSKPRTIKLYEVEIAEMDLKCN